MNYAVIIQFGPIHASWECLRFNEGLELWAEAAAARRTDRMEDRQTYRHLRLAIGVH